MTEAAEVTLQVALDLHQAGRMDEAEAAYAHVLASHPDDGSALHMAGMLAYQRGDLGLAHDRVGRALAGGYRAAPVLEHYGLILSAGGDLDGAAASLRDSLALAPEAGGAWFNLGLVERRAGRLDRAIDALTRAARLLGQAFAEHELGHALQQAGRSNEAAAAYARALERDPGDAKSALNAGVLAQEADDIAAAGALYDRALAADPGLLAARINRASLHRAAGDLAGAEAAYRVILADAPEAAQALNNLAVVLRALGRDAEAERLLRQALAAEPAHAEAGINLVDLLLDAGRSDEAVAVRRAACTAHPGDGRRWLALGRLLERLGSHAEAEAALRRALAAEPSRAEAHTALGDLAQHRRDWTAALAAYSRAADLAPGQPEPQLGLALAGLKSGDAPTALAACERLLRRDRFDQSALAYHALALRQAHDLAAADRLTDPDTLATVIDTGLPPEALAALAADLKALPRRLIAPRGQSVRGGTQTANDLFSEPVDSIQRFRTMLDAIIARYLQERPQDETHPFLAARPARLRYHSWSVVLTAAGRHVPHIHPEGCVSGVFYVAVPPLDGPGEPGRLELGQPGFDLPLPTAPKLRRIAPVPGRLVLFPSYLWHGTRPFAGPGERITIAFDVRR